MAYQISPPPVTGQGAFGMVPGQISAPPSIWDQLNQNVPNYGAMTTSATGQIQNQLAGNLSPSTMYNIGNYGASRGVSLVHPNSPMSTMIGMGLTGTSTEGQVQSGLQNFNQFANTAGSQQQNPALLTNIAETNAVTGSAPDPSQSAAYAKSLYDEYLAKMNPAGGTGSFSASPMSGNPYAGMGFASQGGGGGGWGQIQYNSGGVGGSPYSVFDIYGGGTPGSQLYG